MGMVANVAAKVTLDKFIIYFMDLCKFSEPFIFDKIIVFILSLKSIIPSVALTDKSKLMSEPAKGLVMVKINIAIPREFKESLLLNSIFPRSVIISIIPALVTDEVNPTIAIKKRIPIIVKIFNFLFDNLKNENIIRRN